LSPESHAVGSLVEKIGYVLRARVETLFWRQALEALGAGSLSLKRTGSHGDMSG